MDTKHRVLKQKAKALKLKPHFFSLILEMYWRKSQFCRILWRNEKQKPIFPKTNQHVSLFSSSYFLPNLRTVSHFCSLINMTEMPFSALQHLPVQYLPFPHHCTATVATENGERGRSGKEWWETRKRQWQRDGGRTTEKKGKDWLRWVWTLGLVTGWCVHVLCCIIPLQSLIEAKNEFSVMTIVILTWNSFLWVTVLRNPQTHNTFDSLITKGLNQGNWTSFSWMLKMFCITPSIQKASSVPSDCCRVLSL